MIQTRIRLCTVLGYDSTRCSKFEFWKSGIVLSAYFVDKVLSGLDVGTIMIHPVMYLLNCCWAVELYESDAGYAHCADLNIVRGRAPVGEYV